MHDNPLDKIQMGNKIMMLRRIGNPCACTHNIMRDVFQDKHSQYEGILQLQGPANLRRSKLNRNSKKRVVKPRKFKSKYAAYYRGDKNNASIRRKNQLKRTDTLSIIEKSINQQQKEREGRLAPCIDYFR